MPQTSPITMRVCCSGGWLSPILLVGKLFLPCIKLVVIVIRMPPALSSLSLALSKEIQLWSRFSCFAVPNIHTHTSRTRAPARAAFFLGCRIRSQLSQEQRCKGAVQMPPTFQASWQFCRLSQREPGEKPANQSSGQIGDSIQPQVAHHHGLNVPGL